jgi:hypothetical protein
MGRLLSIALLAAGISAAQTTSMRGIHTHYEFKPPSTKAEWKPRRTQLQQQILLSAGLAPMPAKISLKPRYVKQVRTDMAVVDTLLLETLPGFYVGANLYKPVKPSPKMPAVLVPHGHWANGRVEHIPEYSVPALAFNLARQGYVVLTLDMVGYNDTTQVEHRFSTPEADLWSYTPLGLQLWNSIRALDFLAAMPEVDTSRIAATGASGGGTQTFLLAAVDDRVKFAAPVNMISAYMQGGCVCEGAPGLRVDTFNVELAAIVAPRPMLMVSCTGDWTKNTPREEFPLMQKMYELYDARARVENAHIDAKHNYNADSRAAVYRFLSKHMQPSLSEADLGERPIEGWWQAADLLGGATPSKPTSAELFAAWKDMSRRQFLATTDVNVLRDRLRRVFRVDLVTPAKRETANKAGNESAIVVVYAGAPPSGDEFVNSGRSVTMASVYRHADPAVTAERSFHTYNLAEGVLQVHDILRAIESAPGKGSVEIIPVGEDMIPASLYASVLSSRPARLSASVLAKAESPMRPTFFVPGVERVGGIEAALRIARQKGSR